MDKVDLSGSELYKAPINLFSPIEKKHLLLIEKLFADTEGFLQYYQPIKVNDTYRFVYEGGMPAYHLKTDCRVLNSNLENFIIPEAIRMKGKREVTRFRVWFKNNQALLQDPSLLVARINMAFGVNESPEDFFKPNTGIARVESLNLEELEKRIDEVILEAEEYYYQAHNQKQQIIRQYKKYTYLAYTNKNLVNNKTGISDDAIKRFLKQYDIHFKKPLKELLIEYYKVKFNPKLNFEGELLDKLGFKRCAICYNSSA